jgi:hypothetical protein
MTNNPLAARRADHESQTIFDAQDICDRRNAENLTYMKDWFFYVKETETASGKITATVERMDLPTGTKRWVSENARVKGLIRKITGGDNRLIEEIYDRALRAAPVPIPWEKIPVK